MPTVTTPMEVLSVTAEMVTHSMEPIVKVCTKISAMNYASYRLFCCLDIDECTEETHNCHEMSNATCTDTDGSFYCNCTEGFGGNGTFCDGNITLRLSTLH